MDKAQYNTETLKFTREYIKLTAAWNTMKIRHLKETVKLLREELRVAQGGGPEDLIDDLCGTE